MRNTFAKEINSIAQNDKRVVLLSGDIGNRMFDDLKKHCPNQFINCGIAEANMMSMAAGMALSGLRPVIYTITPFTTARCFEQIKIGVGYHNSPVIIVGTGSGLSYSELGPTHHSLDDIAILRTVPDINILAPADSIELKACLHEAIEMSIPTYIRIGKKGEPNILNQSHNIGIGKSNKIIDGSDYIIFCIGPIVKEAIVAANHLKKEGISLAVISMCSIRPLDESFLKSLINKKFKKWFTLEEHGIIGGLGSAMLEWINDNKLNKLIDLHRIGAKNAFIHNLGNQSYVRKLLKLDSSSIINLIKKE